MERNDGWIRVEERLPGPDDGEQIKGYVRVLAYPFTRKGDGKLQAETVWFPLGSDRDWSVYHDEEPTHWQPLPSPPAEEPRP